MRRSSPQALPLYTPFDGPVKTLYAELVERARAEEELLPGTPGTLSLRARGASGNYWYRRYYNLPSQLAEKLVCKEEDSTAYERMSLRIADRAKAEKDLRQAAVLLAVLVERDAADLGSSLAQAPADVQQAVRRRGPALQGLLAAHPQAQEALGIALNHPGLPDTPLDGPG